MNETETIREAVRERYARAAVEVATEDCGCGPDCCGGAGETVLDVDDVRFGVQRYDEEARSVLPDAVVLASLGCGNPTAVADLHEGETVLDLGSGGGIDVFLSARRVGPTGRVYGLDMTDEMLELARRNQVEAGVDNVEFLKGFMEEVPLPDASVDVVVSNCVVNLSADKALVFAEMGRVLRPGGRIGISDVVASNDLTPEQRAERGTFVGCIAGALSFVEFEEGLRANGFVDISVDPTHEVVPGMFGAIVKAVKPA
jgi:arsenite methyltransferase